MTTTEASAPTVRGAWPVMREWLFASSALRVAQQHPASADQCACLSRASAAMELGEQAHESLRSDAAVSLAVALYRDAAFWALRGLADRPSDVKTLADAFASVDKDWLAVRAGGAEVLESLRANLIDQDAVAIAALDPEVAMVTARRAQRFARALVIDLANRCDVERRLRRTRAARLVALMIGAFAMWLTIIAVQRRMHPDLLAQAPWRASSATVGFPAAAIGQRWADETHNIFFHTNEEGSPWIEFDLRRTTEVRSFGIVNRGDCCLDRAIPLVVEISVDHVQWLEVARRGVQFYSWEGDFGPLPARWIRFRALRSTTLHFASVEAR